MSLWNVPLADIDLGDDEIHAVTDVLRSKWLSMGPVTAEFERQFAAMVGVKHAFAVTNCTAALHLAHLALGAGPGDTVICPALTFVATANAIRYTGAVPVFADVTSAENCNIAPESIAACLDATTKGICVVHYGGYPCDMDGIMALARRHGLYVVEDVAHAPGAGCWVTVPDDGSGGGERVFKQCGSIGDIGCFSFFSNKNLTTGEGGMLTTDNDALADRIKLLRSHGMTSLTWDRDRGHSFSYDVTDSGCNYRIDEMRSALGLVQLRKLETNNQRRAEAVNRYHEKLTALEDIISTVRASRRHLVVSSDAHRAASRRAAAGVHGVPEGAWHPDEHALPAYSSVYVLPLLHPACGVAGDGAVGAAPGDVAALSAHHPAAN